jgi:hypothetical protein
MPPAASRSNQPVADSLRHFLGGAWLGAMICMASGDIKHVYNHSVRPVTVAFRVSVGFVVILGAWSEKNGIAPAAPIFGVL